MLQSYIAAVVLPRTEQHCDGCGRQPQVPCVQLSPSSSTSTTVFYRAHQGGIGHIGYLMDFLFAYLPPGCLAEVRDEYPLPVTAVVIQQPFCSEKGRVMQEKLLQEVSMKSSTVCCISAFIFF